MRIVATVTDRTFYLNHADLCEAWRMSPVGKITRDGDDLVYRRVEVLGTRYDLTEEAGIAYFKESPMEVEHNRADVRSAVADYLRSKFRVRSAVTVTITDEGVEVRSGLY